MKQQRGGFFLGMIVGLLIGLALALGGRRFLCAALGVTLGLLGALLGFQFGTFGAFRLQFQLTLTLGGGVTLGLGDLLGFALGLISGFLSDAGLTVFLLLLG